MPADLSSSPVSIVRGSNTAPFLFICEHASPEIPERFNGLGLDQTIRISHIAWDPGAYAVTVHLCKVFGATAVCGGVSRLIYDLNRPPEAPDAIPARSEIFDIPGNKDLTSEQIAERVEGYYQPFQKALKSEIEGCELAPALVTIHSFTPIYNGQERDVELGILHDEDSRLADAMLAIADKQTTLNTRRNQPYGAENGVTHTLRLHGLGNGLLNVMIEIRNDLLQTSSQCEVIADMLAVLLTTALDTCKIASEQVEARADA